MRGEWVGTDTTSVIPEPELLVDHRDLDARDSLRSTQAWAATRSAAEALRSLASSHVRAGARTRSRRKVNRSFPTLRVIAPDPAT